MVRLNQGANDPTGCEKFLLIADIEHSRCLCGRFSIDGAVTAIIDGDAGNFGRRFAYVDDFEHVPVIRSEVTSSG